MVSEELEKVPMYIDFKEAGASLEEVAVDIIKAEGQNLVSHWYHSPLDVDVYLWLDDNNNIIKQQVSICGQICEWNIVDGVRTGFVVEEAPENNSEERFSSTIHYDKVRQRSCLHQALEVVQFAEALTEVFKEKLIHNFEKNPKVDNIDPKKFIAQYGRKKSERPSVLAKFFKKLFK